MGSIERHCVLFALGAKLLASGRGGRARRGPGGPQVLLGDTEWIPSQAGSTQLRRAAVEGGG